MAPSQLVMVPPVANAGDAGLGISAPTLAVCPAMPSTAPVFFIPLQVGRVSDTVVPSQKRLLHLCTGFFCGVPLFGATMSQDDSAGLMHGLSLHKILRNTVRRKIAKRTASAKKITIS